MERTSIASIETFNFCINEYVNATSKAIPADSVIEIRWQAPPKPESFMLSRLTDLFFQG